MSSYESWNKKDYKSLKFTEIGPYVWDETRSKHDITFNGSDIVTYREEKQYHFNEKESIQNGKLLSKTDQITIINPILVRLNTYLKLNFINDFHFIKCQKFNFFYLSKLKIAKKY